MSTRPCCGVHTDVPYTPIGCPMCNPSFWNLDSAARSNAALVNRQYGIWIPARGASLGHWAHRIDQPDHVAWWSEVSEAQDALLLLQQYAQGTSAADWSAAYVAFLPPEVLR